ncbi:MAG: tetratricopeptide repeat protein, partial [bacterium]
IKRLILYNMSKNPETSERLSFLLTEKEKSPESYLLLGISKEKNKKDDEAEKYYRKAIELGLDEGFVRFGWLLFKNERDDECLMVIEEGLKRFPDDFDLLVLYGVLLSQKKEHQRAITIFKDLIKKMPDDDYLYFQLAVAYDGLLNKSWAIKYLYKAIRLNPKNSASYNYIGYTWAEEGKNLNRAIKLIEKALKIEPDNPAYIDSLGWCYYKMGSLDLALPLLLKAYNLKNDDPVILEHIGDVYNDKGMKNEAEKFWHLSLDKFKEEKDKERVKKKLE